LERDVVQLKNNVSSIIPNGLTSTATSLVVRTNDGVKFPVLSSGDYYFLTIVDVQNEFEIVKVTGQSGDVIQIQRGQSGTTAKVFPPNSRVELRVTVENIIAQTSGNYLIL
jgi:hypothetical protein